MVLVLRAGSLVDEPRPRAPLTMFTSGAWVPEALAARLRTYHPRTELGRVVKDVCRTLRDHDRAHAILDVITRSVVLESALYGSVRVLRRGMWRTEQLGLLSQRLVTDAGVAFLVDAFQNLVELENMKFHAIGTGATAEAATQTALVTELTTQYTPDSTRATGTITETAANIYQTVATNTLSGAGAVLREHAVMSQAATGGGTMLDRSLFNTIDLADGDGFTSDYRLTIASGG